MMRHHVDERKVLIYARHGRRLLVFEEPDFPQVEIQVPGGTVEANETPADAARREFQEETGLALSAVLTPLGVIDHVYERDGRTVRHERHVFAFDFDASIDLPETWLHLEGQPSQGEPVMFRLFWIDVATARGTLGYGMNASLDHPFFAEL